MANQGIYTNSTWVHGVQFSTSENVPLALSGTYECDVLRKGDTGTPVFTFNTADGTLDHTDQAVGRLVLTATPAQHQPEVTAGRYRVYMRRVDAGVTLWAATGEMVVGKPGDSETYIRFDAATDGSTAETYAVALAGPPGTNEWADIANKPVGFPPPDGDKGDISVSSTGTVWTVENHLRSFANRAAVESADLSALAAGATIHVRGHTTEGIGPATYIKLGSAPSPVEAWHVQSDDGGYFAINDVEIMPSMFGGGLPASTDDVPYLSSCVELALVNTKIRKISIERIYTVGTTSCVIDRAVDSARDELVIDGNGCTGGFEATVAVTLFATTNPTSATPICEWLTIRNCRFIAPEFYAGAIYLFSSGFLRVRFYDNYVQGWKFTDSANYLQQFEIVGNNVHRWAGNPWCRTALYMYYVMVHGNTFETGTSTVFRGGGLAGGCQWTNNLAQGYIPGFIDIDGFEGVTVSGNYTEHQTAADYRFIRSAGVIGRGLTFTGNFMQLLNPERTSSSFYSVVWGGDVRGCVSAGNRSNGNMHDDTGVVDGNLTINDAVDLVATPGAVLVKSGRKLTSYPDNLRSQNYSVVAAGGGAAGATLLTASMNLVGTVPTNFDGVKLPKLGTGANGSRTVTLITYAANTCYVYPSTGDTIDFGGGPFALAYGVPRTFYQSNATNWGCEQVAATQAASTAATVADLKTDFNSLLAKLKTAGVVAS